MDVLTDEIRASMLSLTRLGEDEVRSYAAKAVDIAYWKKLNPDFSIDARPSTGLLEDFKIDARRSDELVGKFAREGYFQADPIFSTARMNRLRTCVENVRQEGWLPVFAFAYDEFWMLWKAPSLLRFLSGALGTGHRLIPHMWCFFVTPLRGARGWSPHTDGYGQKNRMSVWIPLTDATLDNGCMYLVPKDLAPQKIPFDAVVRSKSVSTEDTAHLLQSCRALPAQAGSMMGWDFNVIHWGSTVHKVCEPRISLSMDFLGEGEPAHDDEAPLFDAPSALPTFEERIRLIGKAILRYQPQDIRIVRYLDLAARLAEHGQP